MDPLIAFTDHYKTSQTVTDPLIIFTDRYKLLLPATHYTTLYSIADISKQVSEGQRSRDKESTLRLQMTLTTILVLKSLNINTLSL